MPNSDFMPNSDLLCLMANDCISSRTFTISTVVQKFYNELRAH